MQFCYDVFQFFALSSWMKSIYRNKALVQWCTKKYLLYTSAVGPKRWRSDGCGHSCGKVRTSDRQAYERSILDKNYRRQINRPCSHQIKYGKYVLAFVWLHPWLRNEVVGVGFSVPFFSLQGCSWMSSGILKLQPMLCIFVSKWPWLVTLPCI